METKDIIKKAETKDAFCFENCLVSKYTSPIWHIKLNSQMSHNWYKKGQFIYYENNPVFGLHFICEGKVKIIATGLKGKEQIVRLAATGNILGHWQADTNETYTTSAVTIEDSLICFLSNDILQEAFLANSELTLNLMHYYSKELNKSEKRLKYLSQTCINERMAEALLYLIEIFGISSKNSRINGKLSRREIGSIIGATSEQVSRVLSAFKTDNIIDTLGKDIIILDKVGLENLIKREQVSTGQNL